ncbi:hypothetical protein [Sorangium atrum]|uniref:Transposase n=1 Tax=Sorangium atrum TaxID=2995308 RepID=A0ABT5C1G3_9BACT|nr:hypothetical protein [Sorangium aterium]MDC0679026.1 hypothetical protein [Sorangium aterium]MDC0685948.1 hypothetical protein [Sorangium aterium]
MAKPLRKGDERSDAAPSAVSERGARDVVVGALLTMVHGEVERERVSTALGAVLPSADVGFVSEGISVRHLDRLLHGSFWRRRLASNGRSFRGGLTP